MTDTSRLGLFICLVAPSVALAQPGATPPIDSADENIQPPGQTAIVDDLAPPPSVTVRKPVKDPLATTRKIGFGIRATGLSGIGALPGVNYGGELSGMIRYNEMFAELAGPSKSLREKPVERIGERRTREQRHDLRIPTVQEPERDGQHEHHAQHAQERGEMPQSHGR